MKLWIFIGTVLGFVKNVENLKNTGGKPFNMKFKVNTERQTITITGENSIREVYELIKKYVEEVPVTERPGRCANPFVRRQNK